MALEPIKLDDLTWSQMTQAIRNRIAASSGGRWTLHSPVDPGITLLELFAWLLEQRVYWMDQTPDSLVLAALRLLGADMPSLPKIASTVLELLDQTASSKDFLQVPSATEFEPSLLGSSVKFSLSEGMTLLPVADIQLKVATKDRTNELRHGRIIRLFPADGSYAEVIVTLSLHKPFPFPVPQLPFSLFFELSTPVDIAPQWSNDAVDVTKPVEVQWRYRQKNGSLTPFDFVNDGTSSFRRSGVVRLGVPVNWIEEATGGYAIFISINKTTFSYPPRLSRLVPNAAIARHLRQTQFHQKHIQWLPLPGNMIDLTAFYTSDSQDIPPLVQDFTLRLVERDGQEHAWTPTDDFTFHGPDERVFVIDRELGRLRFGDGLNGRMPVLESLFFGVNDIKNLPSLIAKLQNDPNQPTSLISKFIWEQFDQNTKELLVDPNTTQPQQLGVIIQALNKILQGDSIYEKNRFASVSLCQKAQSLVTQHATGWDLIRLNRLLLEDAYSLEIGKRNYNVKIQYWVGGGEGGNIGAPAYWTSNLDVRNENSTIVHYKLSAKTLVPAEGGMDAETIAVAAQRAATFIKKTERAVTASDFEELALTTPGVNIGRAHAAIGFHPDFPCYPMAGVVTVFVVPNAPRERLDTELIENAYIAAVIPDPGVLAEVRVRLNEARLVGTEVFVEPPRYQPVRLDVLVETSSSELKNLQQQINDRLRTFLDPLVGGDERQGWPFGGVLRSSILLREVQDAIGDGGTSISVGIQLLNCDKVSQACQDIKINAHDLVELKDIQVYFKRKIAPHGGLR